MAYRKLSYTIISIILLIIILISSILFYNKQNEIIIADYSDLYEEVEENFSLNDYRIQKIEYLIIHCTASQVYHDKSKQWYLDFFKNERKWNRPGYHMIIASDGRIDTLVNINNDEYIQFNELVNGVAGYNSKSIHVSYQGGIDKKGYPKDTRTIEQKQKLEEIIKNIKLKYPWIKIRGHNNFANKACPSFDVIKEYSFIK